MPAPLKHLLPLLPAVGLLACNPWENLPDQDSYWMEGPLWDPSSAVAAQDGVYIALPHAGALARVKDDGTFNVVDLDGAEVVRMVATPDAAQVIVWDRWRVCEDPEAEKVEDCNDDELSWSYELSVVQDGAVSVVTEIPPHLNRLAFSPDGGTAVAYLDFDAAEDVPVDGVVDLTQVAFVDLDSGAVQSLSVGFSANNVIFSLDGSRAVVLSRSQVVVVDLTTFEKTVTYPLTLDADQQVDPNGAALTPDGRYALITIEGSKDLYKLDLDVEAIDIISLDGAPATLSVNNDQDKSLLVYASLARVDVLEHEYFGIETLELDEPCTAVLETATTALLYNDQARTHDVYELDFATMEPVEYVMANPVQQMELTASGGYAVAVLSPEYGYSGNDLDDYQDNRYGLGVIDLNNDESVSLVLESEPVGAAVVEDDSGSFALLLLEGLDTLLKVDLANPSVPAVIELEESPTGIGALPDGRFFITHDSPLGLVSFLDPATDTLTSTAGFGAVDLQGDDELPRLAGEE